MKRKDIMTDRIELKDVSVTFTQSNKQFHAVKNASLKIKKGEIFGIVGLSGAGKSTLIRTLNLLQPPTTGSVLIDGEDISSYKGNDLRNVRKKIGMIFQQFNLLNNKTVKQNIEFALKASDYPKNERESRIDELLALVDLSDKKDVYPSSLSGGQKQRIGIARALANNPEILLCDEATSALDVETTEEILKILERINKELGLTIVFITHELEVAKRLFHRMAVMENGEIVEMGDTFDIFSNPQADITKKLVGRYFKLTLPNELNDVLRDGLLIELRYQGEGTLDPLISSISQKYQVSISIIHGKIEYISGKAIGILYVYIDGEKAQINQAVQDIKEQVYQFKILSEEGEISGING